MRPEVDGESRPAGSENVGAGRSAPAKLFREEALRHHLGRREYGDVLRPLPRWTRWAYLLILSAACIALLFLCLGTAKTYVRGPAAVRASTLAETGTMMSAGAG